MNNSKRQEVRTQGRFRSENENSSSHQRARGRGSYSARSPKKNAPQEDASPSHESHASNQDVMWDDDINGLHFSKLEDRHAPKVIKNLGFHVLSNTENGESRVYFEPNFINSVKSSELLQKLYKNVEWNKKNIVIHGQEYPQPRLVAWYGPLPYTYSGVTLKARPFPDLILKIKEQVESSLQKKNINVELNSVLLNLYRDGKDSVAWHSDDELSMGICPTIASVSLGEVRRFEMRRIPDEPRSTAKAEYVVYLNSGSLIVMDGVMQQDWQHRVPKEYHDKSKRINLTFRTVFPLEKVSRPLTSRTGHSEVPEDVTIFPSKVKQESFEFQEESFPSLGESIPLQTKDISTKSKNYNSTCHKINPPRQKWEKDSLCNNNSSGGRGLNNGDSRKNEDWDTQVCNYNDSWDSHKSDSGMAHEGRVSPLKGSEDSCNNIKNYGKDSTNHHNVNVKCENSGIWDTDENDSDVINKGKKDVGEGESVDGSSKYSDGQGKVLLNHDCGIDNSDSYRTGSNSCNIAEPDKCCMPYDSSNNSEQKPSNLNFDTSGYNGQEMNLIHEHSKMKADSKVATSEEIIHNSKSQVAASDFDPSLPNRGVPKGDMLEDFMGNCYWYPPLEITDTYRTECQKLSDLYQYVYTNWHDIPLHIREKKELEVLLTVIEESGPLRLKAVQAVANEMAAIIENAELRGVNRAYYPTRNLQFSQRRSYHNTSRYRQQYRDRY